MLVDISKVVEASRTPRGDDPAAQRELLHDALQGALGDLHSIRKTYNFDSLVGSSAAHAVATPALQDIERWLAEGLPGMGYDDAVVLAFAEQRAKGAHDDVQRVFDAANSTAATLVAAESERLGRLQESISYFLVALPLFALAMVFVLLKKRAVVQELRANEDWLRRAFDGSGVAMALLSNRGAFVHTNAAFRMLVGYEESELASMSFEDLAYSEDKADRDIYWAQMMSASRSAYHTESRYRHRDGGTLWGLESGTFIRDTGSRTRTLIIQIQDITAKRKALAAVREREEQYRRIFEVSSDGLVVVSSANKLIDANAAACAMFGRTRNALLELTPSSLFRPHSKGPFASAATASGPQEPFRGELKGVRSDGFEFDAEVFATPYLMRGEPHFLASLRDVSERKQAERLLEDTTRDFELLAHVATHDFEGAAALDSCVSRHLARRLPGSVG